jgi:spore coat polysaccharide biosynthesis predicted glycosyltransferase SpsG
MMQFFFRVDASNTIGMGHFMECIALADFFKKTFNCGIHFLVNDFTPMKRFLEKRGNYFDVVQINGNEDFEHNSLEQIVKGRNPDFLICNLLERSNEYYRKIQSYVRHSIVILDDEFQRPVPGNVVINFNITQDPDYYRHFGGKETRYCIGPQYIPLSDTLYVKWSKKKEIPDSCGTIFLNQGGSDPFGLTAKIIHALEGLDLEQIIHVVVGDAVSVHQRRELKSLMRSLSKKYQFEWGASHEKMRALMEQSDLAITAAGNTLYELAILGVPSIVICHHERHNRVASKFAERGAAVNLGIGSDISESVIAAAVKNLLDSREKRIRMSEAIKLVVDGKGCRRIAEMVESLC